MNNKFQQLYENIMGNIAGAGGSFGSPVDFNDNTKADVRTSMAVTGQTSTKGPRKNKKKKTFPILRRPPIKTGGL
jgi:hypothetical protein